MANGLLNLQTDLKSLRYGSDKPYITKDINDPPSSNQTGMQITKRIDDTSRIAQMLIDRPGLKYLGNEALLQQVNVGDKIRKAKDKNKSTVGAVLQQAGNTLVSTAKIAGSTLAQVPVNGTGTHFLKGFRTDTYLRPDPEGVQPSGFAAFFGAGGVEGAPYALSGKEIPMHINSDMYDEKTGKLINTSSLGYDEKVNKPLGEDTSRALAEAGKPITIPGPQWETTAQPFELGRSNELKEADQGELKEYTPAPFVNNFTEGSTYDNKITPAGSASVIRTINSTVTDVKETPIKLSEVKPDSGTIGNDGTQKYTANKTYTGTNTKSNIGTVLAGSFITVTDKVDAEQRQKVENSRLISGSSDEKVIDSGSANRNVSDFRTGPTSFNYSSPTINKETRINLGNQGKNTGAVSYSTVDRTKIDELNALEESGTRIDGTNEARDLAKFYFEIITPNETKFLHFRAHIDSIDDSYSGEWDSHQYVGRAEEFFTYKGFKRDINVGFKISAQSRAEMKPLYRKMVYLASATAPTYGGGSNFMRGTLARLTIGSYFAQIPGIITSVKYTWQTDYQWEIAMQNPEGGIDDDQQELPMTLDCSISFKPIHDFAPQTGLKHFFTSPKPLNGSKPFF
jgi:hypothetical protein